MVSQKTGLVSSIMVMGANSCSTDSNLYLGDHVSKVVSIYGLPDRVQNNGLKLIYLISNDDKKQLWIDYDSMNKEKVAFIQLVDTTEIKSL